jgi:hypothetical protein
MEDAVNTYLALGNGPEGSLYVLWHCPELKGQQNLLCSATCAS